MFLFVAAEQFRRAGRRLGQPVGAKSADHLVAAKPSSLVPVTVGTLAGMRYQVFRALRAMANGQYMLVEHQIPASGNYFKNSHKQIELLNAFSSVDSWQNHNEIEPVLVPGTAHTYVIGRILLRAGWCAPCSQPHWVPNLRLFFLTEVGHESFMKAQAWWSELTTRERLRVMLFE